MKNRLGQHRGIALIAVLLVIVILMAIAIEVNRSTRTDIYDAANLRDGIKLTYIAKSGFYGAAVLLTRSTKNYDTLLDDWTHIETISLQSNTLFPEGYFIAKVEDEEGKIPLNKLVKPGGEFNPEIKEMLTRLLSQPEFKLNSRQIDEIVDSLKDWIDPDDLPTGQGGESNYYESLTPPYKAKNAPLDCIEELLMIKGISPALFYGTKDTPALANYVTANSEGSININTAPTMVLRCLSNDITKDLADRMDECRRREDTDLSDPQWYRRVDGMEGISINPALITVRSRFFKIISTGKMDMMSRTVSGIVQKQEKQAVKIITWRMD